MALRPALVVALPLVFALWSPTSLAGGARPSTWAEPVQQPGLSNLYRVTPTLYRGAQPTAEGMKSLVAMGVKTVINLRNYHSDRGRLSATGLRYIHFNVSTAHPEHHELVEFLKAATAPANQPVFVHCQHGSDRTGMMIAVYRMVVQGWTREEAIRELREGGYGFHSIFWHIPQQLKALDLERLRQEAGLPQPTAAQAPAAATGQR